MEERKVYICLTSKPFLLVITREGSTSVKVICLWDYVKIKYILRSAEDELIIDVPMFSFRLFTREHVEHFLNEVSKVMRLGVCKEITSDLLNVLKEVIK